MLNHYGHEAALCATHAETVPVATQPIRTPSQCFVIGCFLWCDWQWWQWQQTIGATFDPQNTELNWRHTRTGQHLRSGSIFVKTCGDFWKRDAASTDWPKSRGAFRQKAYQIFGARSFEDRFRAAPQSRGSASPLSPSKKPRHVMRKPPTVTASRPNSHGNRWRA